MNKKFCYKMKKNYIANSINQTFIQFLYEVADN